jgi:hypothetical protein
MTLVEKNSPEKTDRKCMLEPPKAVADSRNEVVKAGLFGITLHISSANAGRIDRPVAMAYHL